MCLNTWCFIYSFTVRNRLHFIKESLRNKGFQSPHIRKFIPTIQLWKLISFSLFSWRRNNSCALGTDANMYWITMHQIPGWIFWKLTQGWFEKLISAQSQQQQRTDTMIKITVRPNFLRASKKKKKKKRQEGISLQNRIVFEMFA